MSPNKPNFGQFFSLFTDQISTQLISRSQCKQSIPFLKSHPTLSILWFSEIQLALDTIKLLPHSLYSLKLNNYPELINLDHLLKQKQFLLQSPHQMQQTLCSHPKLMESIFIQMDQDFNFLDTLTPIYKFLPAFHLAFYRTSQLVMFPQLKSDKVQVASAIEEALATLALGGFSTQIFQATKHWIFDFQSEGFSPSLAIMIKEKFYVDY